MIKGTVEIYGTVFEAVQAEYGKCCVVCDLGQIRCGLDCQRFEENGDDYVALKMIKKDN